MRFQAFVLSPCLLQKIQRLGLLATLKRHAPGRHTRKCPFRRNIGAAARNTECALRFEAMRLVALVLGFGWRHQPLETA
jgi:hypothetical protein